MPVRVFQTGPQLQLVRLAAIGDRDRLREVVDDISVLIETEQTAPDIRQHDPERSPVRRAVGMETHLLPEWIERQRQRRVLLYILRPVRWIGPTGRWRCLDRQHAGRQK